MCAPPDLTFGTVDLDERCSNSHCQACQGAAVDVLTHTAGMEENDVVSQAESTGQLPISRHEINEGGDVRSSSSATESKVDCLLIIPFI